MTTLYEGRTKPVFASICLLYDRLGSDIVCQGSIEKGLADPVFKVLEGCICKGIQIPFSKLFPEEHCFGGQTR